MSQHNLPGFHRVLREDVARYNETYSLANVVKLYLKDRNFRVIFSLRLCQATARKGGLNKLLHLIGRTLHRWNQHSAACDLSWKTQIGPGFHITHGWGLVITPGAVIGRNVTVFHGVTIGRKDVGEQDKRKTFYPRLEDNVWVGPHALIIGVTIGQGSVIGGHSVVTHDVAPGAVMAGNPARILRRDGAAVMPETGDE